MVINKEYFNLTDILYSGQIFRFTPFKDGFLIFSGDKVCYAFEKENSLYIESETEEYFYNFFDLNTDYKEIVESAKKENIEVLTKALSKCSGVRILRQLKEEMFFSFIISQNNNIKRIQNSIEKLCFLLGDKKEFLGYTYYAFPSIERLAEQEVDFFKSIGLGYRAEYIKENAVKLLNGEIDLEFLGSLPTKELLSKLISLKGIGEKVANCIALFGFYKTDTFPVDTWIEKVYKENIKGSLTDRKKIADYYIKRFDKKAGYYQQYLFYYKRSIEKMG
ncbi:MAG: DNA-3-methyladenine glycosylase 2 family protein [Clostridiales bacterium]|nr:DNA-3-methyladenine glycosylase 2 family protein [Clostridiales bacterium]